MATAAGDAFDPLPPELTSGSGFLIGEECQAAAMIQHVWTVYVTRLGHSWNVDVTNLDRPLNG